MLADEDVRQAFTGAMTGLAAAISRGEDSTVEEQISYVAEALDLTPDACGRLIASMMGAAESTEPLVSVTGCLMIGFDLGKISARKKDDEAREETSV